MMFGRGYNGIADCFGFGPGFMYGGGMLMMAGLLILAVVALVLFVKRNGPKKSTAGDEVLEALKMRLVRGEITEEEYIRRKNILS